LVLAFFALGNKIYVSGGNSTYLDDSVAAYRPLGE
jgi:hypothetical protein